MTDTKSYRIRDLDINHIPIGLPIIEVYIRMMFIRDVNLVYNTDTTVYFEVGGQLYTPEKVLEHIEVVEQHLPIAKAWIEKLIENNGDFPGEHPKI